MMHDKGKSPGPTKPNKLQRTNWPAFIILLIIASTMLLPFVWMVLSTFKTPQDVYRYPPKWLPSAWNLDNFRAVFRLIPFWRYYGNSILTSVIQTFLQIGTSVTAAFALAKLTFPGKHIVSGFLVSSMFVPAVVTMIPMYLITASLRLLDTYTGIILPQIQVAFTVMLLVSFFSGLPDDLVLAAKLDGCNNFQILSHVMIPNNKGPIATATLFAFLGNWKSYLWPLLVTNSTKMRTLPIGLKYLVQESSSEYQVMMAASLMAILPVLIVFTLFEEQLVRSVTLTGLKA